MKAGKPLSATPEQLVARSSDRLLDSLACETISVVSIDTSRTVLSIALTNGRIIQVADYGGYLGAEEVDP